MMKDFTSLCRGASLVFLATLSLTASALTVKNPAFSVEELTKKSDEIIIGNVIAEEPAVIGRTFETRYKIQVTENLKTRGELPAGRTITMTLPGASLTTPPITQYVSGVPYMAKGEEVLLFLRNGSPAPQSQQEAARNGQPVSGLSESPKVVGWNQGRFSVLTHPTKGKKMVTRVNLENYGLINSARGMKEIMEGVATQQIPLVEKAFMRLEDKAAEAKDRDPLEITAGISNKIKAEGALQKGAVLGQMRQRGGIPVQSLDEFKAQIQGFAAE